MSSKLVYSPLLYARYVDDIFTVFDSENKVEQFLNMLNSLHPNLKFTYEIGPKNIAFLDTEIHLPTDKESNFISKVYRKATNTNVILNFAAICPSQWKNSIMTCFVNRAYTVSSTWSLFHEEISKLSDIFRNNGYPPTVFDKCVNKFLENKLSNEEKPLDNAQSKTAVILCIPYIGHPSRNFKRLMSKISKRINIETRIVFQTFRVGNYFSLKDRTPLDLMAKVVYQYSCSCDKSLTYIGKTKRHLTVRSKEHFQRESPIRNHIQSCSKCKYSDMSNFNILNSGRTDYEIRIKEALYINNLKPILNRQIPHSGASYFLNVF